MPTKKQIIIIAVLSMISLGLGYWYGMPEKGSGGGGGNSGGGKENAGIGGGKEEVVAKELGFLKQGLVAYYPFNGNANDESGNDGRVEGAILTKDRNEKDGQAYSFDGKSNVVKINDHELLRPARITLSAWIKTKKIGMLVSKTTIGTAKGEQYYLCYGYGREPRINFSIKRNSNGIAARGWQRGLSENYVKSRIEGDDWVMVSATWDEEIQIVYINGEIVGRNTSAPKGGIDNIKGGDLLIGQYWDGAINAFKGSIDDVRIYNRALSEAEVKALYEFEKPKTQQASTTT